MKYDLYIVEKFGEVASENHGRGFMLTFFRKRV